MRVLWVLTVFTERCSRSPISVGPEALDQQAQHLELAVGQRLVRRLVARLQQAGGGGLGDVHAAGGDLAQRADQQLGGAVLVEVARGAGLERARRVLLLAVHREHQDAQLRLLELEALDEVDARRGRASTCRAWRRRSRCALHQRERLVAARRLGGDLRCRRWRRGCASGRRARCLWSSAMQDADHAASVRPAGRAAARAAAARVPPRGARADLERAAEVGDALAHALQAERARLGEVRRRDAAAVVLDLDVDARRPRTPSTTQAFFAPAWRAMLVSDSWIARYTAVATGLGDAPASVAGELDAAGDARALGEVVHQPARRRRRGRGRRASAGAGRPRCAASALTVWSSSAPISAPWRAVAGSAPAGARAASARSIFSAVSSWPSSSCSSRAMRVFSSSRASSTRADSSRSSLLRLRAARPRPACARVMSRRITVK